MGVFIQKEILERGMVVKRISGEALELFYRLDRKKYLIDFNLEVKNWLEKLDWSYPDQEIQDFIDKVNAWYFVKFPNRYIQSILIYHKTVTGTSTLGMSLENLFRNFNTIELELFDFKDQHLGVSKEKFCQYLVQLVGYKMIYSKNTNPEFGFIRARFLFFDFNHYFGWNLDTSLYDEVMNRDYSMNIPSNVSMLRKLREVEKKQEKKKSRGLRRFLHR